MSQDSLPLTVFQLSIPGYVCAGGCGAIVCREHGAASSDVISRENVGGIIKCSGDRLGMRPPTYGANYDLGWPLEMVPFTVNHWDTVCSVIREVIVWMMEI